MLSPKPSVLALLVGGLCASSAFAAAPGKPTIGWGETKFAIVEVDRRHLLQQAGQGARRWRAGQRELEPLVR